MNTDNSEFVNSILRKLSKLNYIKPGDVPNIDLYMDQVTTFMDEHLSDVKRYADDKILTKTMINNYTKNNLLPPPVKKKYSKDHVYIMAFIYYFKNILSINDIQKLLTPLTDNFFEKDESPSLDSIYKEVYRLEKSQLSNISKDVFTQYKLSENAFEDVEDKEDQRFLQLFTFVSLLSFDVYMKKNIIENIIDELNAYGSADSKKPKDRPKSKEKASKNSSNTNEKTAPKVKK